MTSRNPDSSTARNAGALGVEAARTGNLQTAQRLLERAIRAEQRQPAHRLNLAAVLEQRGDMAAAARRLSETLRLDPASRQAASRLSSLLARYNLPEPDGLDPYGLKAALTHDTVDQQPLAEAAIAHLSAGPLGKSLEQGRAQGWRETARTLVLKKTAGPLREPLFLAALQRGINTDAEIERLLTAIREVLLLEADTERFRDRHLAAFACSLIGHLINNEYVFATGDAEQAALEDLNVAPDALTGGHPGAARDFLLLSLYRPFEQTLPADVAPETMSGLRPKALRDLVQARLAEMTGERSLAAEIGRIGTIRDSTSRRVAAQYETSPYPRWRSLRAPAEGSARRALQRHFEPGRLAFMEQPFDVLIAGCGTGQHVISSALAYGGNASVLAIDLSTASLAYAKRMAASFGADNIEFAQADILGLEDSGRRFDIIECVGVLHHLAEPLEGWRIITRLLRPGGLMFVGLYSAVSRGNLAALRDDPEYPGLGCSDDDARAYRRVLMTRREGEPGHELTASADFYSLSAFRDLALHESEAHLTLPEIRAFLGENGLAFRGFVLAPEIQRAFADAFPDDAWPGRLENWSAFEQRNPRLFDAMYQFWCEKTG